jgi:hypothetical protein
MAKSSFVLDNKLSPDVVIRIWMIKHREVSIMLRCKSEKDDKSGEHDRSRTFTPDGNLLTETQTCITGLPDYLDNFRDKTSFRIRLLVQRYRS